MTANKLLKVLQCLFFLTNVLVVCKADLNNYSPGSGAIPFRPGIRPVGPGIYPPGSSIHPFGPGRYPSGRPDKKPAEQPGIQSSCNVTRHEQPMKPVKVDKRTRKTCPSKTTECTPEQEKKLSGFNRKQHMCCAKPSGPRIQKTLTVCCDGWMYKNDTCQPICRGCDMEHGYCVSPGVCGCKPGYILLEGKECREPVCDPPCVNGKCVNDSTCACDLDFSPLNATHCAPTCEPGLFLDPKTLTCKPPICNPPCYQGECTAPNVCTCNEGYTNENSSTCLPICDPPCINGDCILPYVCACKIGYETETSTSCKPTCDDCENGKCIAPNVCKCHAGYSKKGGHKCTADCAKKCVNATCEAPNKCVCSPGYESTADSTVCRPKCHACHHGDCIAPLNCQCHDGYQRGLGGCLPVCAIPCVNGDCTEPNICTCHQGFQKESLHGTDCKKPCDGPCEDGTCTFFGECICYRGYELRNGTCKELKVVECSTCEHNCSHGDCYCTDNRPCNIPVIQTDADEYTSLAGLELTWILCGAVALLLLVTLVVVMQLIYRRRKQLEAKAENCQDNNYSSVMFTMPDTLMQRNIPEDIEEERIDVLESKSLDGQSMKTVAQELLCSNSESES